jgi:malate dehydrogenase (oxaloacetate-decarboxylating)
MMLKFKRVLKSDGKLDYIETLLTGKDLLSCSHLNKGTAFSEKEREVFSLTGKLPEAVEVIDEQLARSYHQYKEKSSDLAKNVYLNSLHDTNEILFYRLLSDHLVEMLPIVYTPTVGEAVEKFSLELRRSRGIFLSYPKRDQISEMLSRRNNEEIDLILVTDGEGVLGIGDQGIGGMDISIAKLMVYTLCGGINPNRVLPIQLDVGTNNKKLLDDPLYLGWRHERVTGPDYDDFIGDFVSAVQERFPGVYLHWEDFGRENARKNLNRYRDKMATFNDDMQGTGATALACVLAAVKATDTKLEDHRFAVLGAGTAGVGIVDQICSAMVQEGMSEEKARRCFWLVDREGLLCDDMDSLVGFQEPYVRPKAEVASWQCEGNDTISYYDVVKNAQPTVLIGCSTVKGAFSEKVIKEMLNYTDHPIVFPMSNPTSHAEAEPNDVLAWTNGAALVATGSPFEPVDWHGKSVRIAQANNAYVFPGLGMGVIASKATRVTDQMIRVAADVLSDNSPAMHDKSAPLLPALEYAVEVSRKIALAVATQARAEGVAGVSDDVDLSESIEKNFWKPDYYPYSKG